MRGISFRVVLFCAVLIGPLNGFIGLHPVRRQSMPQLSSIVQSQLQSDISIDLRGVQFSSLQGKALQPKEFPSLAEVKALLPPETFQKDTLKSLSFAALDLYATGSTAFLGIKYALPYAVCGSFVHRQALAALIWALYSIVVGS